jgi:glycosyltransferase involved in cell wall biosynthesis
LKTGDLKILFVLSGNRQAVVDAGESQVMPVKNPVHQAGTLREAGHEVDFFFIRNRGLVGYIGSIPRIRKKIREGGYDIIHAHYSLTAFAVSLSGCHRMVVSLTGSDVLGLPLLLPLTRLFCRMRWSRVIVKTEEMKKRLGCSHVSVIPNGVNTVDFAPASKEEARQLLGLPDKRIILFAADPSRKEKNYRLAEEAVNRLGRNDVILLPVKGIPHDQMPLRYNAADLLLVTSLWEGSINSVKEAMACNLPVVSTDVGDVRANTEGIEGYYITSHDPEEIAERVATVLEGRSVIKARERLFELRLDAASSAERLIEVYNSVISQAVKKAGTRAGARIDDKDKR